KSLEDVNVSVDTLIDFAPVREITVRSVLRKILRDQDMTYVIKDEVIYVTSAVRAREFMTTKTYYVGDLVTGLGPYGNPLQVGAGLAQQQEDQNDEMILNLIRESIDPQSWQGNGGAGTISYNRVTKAFIVRQSAEIHSLMRSGLLK